MSAPGTPGVVAADTSPGSHATPAGSPSPVVTLEPLDVSAHLPRLHAWLTHPRSAAWEMGHLTADEVRAYFDGVAADPHQQAWLGRVDGAPTFLVETYDPAHVLLTDVHDPEPGDVGMHLLVAPPTGAAEHGLTSAVMREVVRFVLDDLGAARVVVEPDVTNTRIAAKNAAAGFRVLREVDLPGKRALLSVCTRADLAASPLGRTLR
ncbi:GNAT family N-acetyltransferase [Cellulomonas septica]|uniref:Lysine N-acyltransferase MbtK n=1 Tax=Cellulomonas septica TaxID=285080 RepID=A0ABX1JWW5_9CELL|nr:GNAT family N-acetyltransferase [Cellulomonas septica]NKY38816.1 acetyltransferase [Cellulomonas septica]